MAKQPGLFRKIGRVRFGRDMIESNPHRFMAFMGRCIVMRAEMHWHSNQIEYVICSDMLDAVDPLDVVPEYNVKFFAESNGWEFVPLTTPPEERSP